MGNEKKFSLKKTGDKDYLKKEMNLLPQAYGERKRKTLKTLGATALCLAFAASLFAINLNLENTLKALELEKAELDRELAALYETEEDQELLVLLGERIDSKSEAIKAFELSAPKMTPILNILESHLPEDVLFSSLSKSDAGLTVTGIARNPVSVAEYLHNLKTEPIFESVVAGSISSSNSENAPEGFFFNIQCRFRKEGGDGNETL